MSSIIGNDSDLPGQLEPDLKIPYFDLLSEELVVRIASHLKAQWDRAAFCLSCKRHRLAAEPFLYSDFHQHLVDTKALPLFLITIIQNKRLRGLVKTVVVACGPAPQIDVSFIKKSEWELIANTTVIAYSPETAKDYDQRMADTFVERLEHGCWNTFIALLFCFLPNVQHIHMRLCDILSAGYNFLEEILDRAKALQMAELESEFALSKLRSICIEGDPFGSFPSPGTSLFYLFPYLSLPSVKQMSAHMIGRGQSVESPALGLEEQGPRSYFLHSLFLPDLKFQTESLTLDHCFLYPIEFSNIITLFTSLKRLKYELDYKFEVVNQEGLWHTEIVPPFIGDCLVHLKRCLEELVLLQRQYLNVATEEDATQPINTLSGFKKLRVIEASEAILFGWPDYDTNRYTALQVSNFAELFPSSLEHLTIRHCKNNLESCRFMARWFRRGLPQNLSTVELVFDGHASLISRTGLIACKQLEKGFLEKGVKFIYPFTISDDNCQKCGEMYLNLTEVEFNDKIEKASEGDLASD